MRNSVLLDTTLMLQLPVFHHNAGTHHTEKKLKTFKTHLCAAANANAKIIRYTSTRN